MGERYDVDVELRLSGADKAEDGTKKVSNAVLDLAAKVRGVQSPFAGVVRSALALGGAYLGVSAIGGAFVHSSKSAFGFQAELERTKIGLASVLSATQGYSFAQGMTEGSKVFKQLSDDAIKSTATTKELFDIYQSIVGPISAAGKGLTTVRTITNDTVAAASALGVDFAQSSRDINMMVRGRAGAEVMLFSKLKSVGAIKETAEAFNKLTTAQRIDKIQAALGKFAPAAEAYGKSWAGVTSTFTDIVQQLSAAAYGPAFESIKRFVGGLNDRMLANREAITGFMTRIGSVLGEVLDSTFDRATKGVDYVVTHWDEINARIRHTVDQVKEMLPHLIQAAKAYAVVSAVRSVAAPALTAAGYALKGAEMVGLLGAPAAAAAGSTAAAATAGAAGAAAASTGAAATGAAGAGAAGAAGMGVGGALLAAGAALAGIAAVAMAVVEQFEPLSAVFAETFVPLAQEMWGLAQAIGSFLTPVLKTVGHVLVLGLGPAFVLVTDAIRLIIGGWRNIFEVLGKVTNFLYDSMKPTIDSLYDAFKRVAEYMRSWVDRILGEQQTVSGQRGLGGNYYRADQDNRQFRMAEAPQFDLRTGQNPMEQAFKGKTPTVVNDFRGSKIEVKQTFKDADPDRVLIQMVDDLNRQSEMRTRSGYGPALGGA